MKVTAEMVDAAVTAAFDRVNVERIANDRRAEMGRNPEAMARRVVAMRGCAGQGMTATEAAAAMGLTVRAVRLAAARNGFKFKAAKRGSKIAQDVNG